MNATRPDLAWLADPRRLCRQPAGTPTRTMCATALRRRRPPAAPACAKAWTAPGALPGAPCPAARPADFWQPDADLSAFGAICVPGHIEMQGYGQIQYANTIYPWDGRSGLTPPQIDWDDDPVGSYVTDFTLDEGLRGPARLRLL